MLDNILNNPHLAEYLTAFRAEQIIFMEGDDSQDLYMLVSGSVDIYKGDKKIREVTRQGAFFGEMSFFMGGKRTASVKAQNEVNVIRIPKEAINDFLQDHPDAAKEITKRLARWLDEATQIVYGLKEFCDQLPDAVIITDSSGKMLAWNSAAEHLYGKDWHQMSQCHVDEIYEDPKGYQDFLEEVKTQYSVREKIFQIIHPQKGRRFISTSTTILYDGHHNYQGVLSLGRDVTSVKQLEKKYKNIAYWLVSILILLGLISTTLLISYPYFLKGYQSASARQMQLRNHLAKDYHLLMSLLQDPIERGSRSDIRQVMKNFFAIQKITSLPYSGLILLDGDKNVVEAYSINPISTTAVTTGSSYEDIKFHGRQDSLHKVLTVYRSDKNHPMGKKGIELAFELHRDDIFLGWLLFQMDVEELEADYGLDAKQLEDFQFE
jgi:PAS domain S-box-containing protein